MLSISTYIYPNKKLEYLNEMTKKGFILSQITKFGTLKFDQKEPQDKLYKIEKKIFLTKKRYDEYIMSQSNRGWKLVNNMDEKKFYYDYIDLYFVYDGASLSKEEEFLYKQSILSLIEFNINVYSILVLMLVSVSVFFGVTSLTDPRLMNIGFYIVPLFIGLAGCLGYYVYKLIKEYKKI